MWQLKRWGFLKAKVKNHGTTPFSYAHPLFRRGDFQLCMQISCSDHTQSFTNNSMSTSIVANRPLLELGANQNLPALDANRRSSLPCRLDSNNSSGLRFDDPIHIARLTTHNIQHPTSNRSRRHSLSGTTMMNQTERYVNEQPSYQRRLSYERLRLSNLQAQTWNGRNG